MKIIDLETGPTSGFVHPVFFGVVLGIVSMLLIMVISTSSGQLIEKEQTIERLQAEIENYQELSYYTLGIIRELDQDTLIPHLYEYGGEEERRIVGALYYYFPTREEGEMWREGLSK